MPGVAVAEQDAAIRAAAVAGDVAPGEGPKDVSREGVGESRGARAGLVGGSEIRGEWGENFGGWRLTGG